MPDTVRALTLAATVLKKHQIFTNRQQNLPDRAGKPWSEEEDKRLLETYDADTPMNDISILHGRTVGAIKSRLVKHGRIKNS